MLNNPMTVRSAALLKPAPAASLIANLKRNSAEINTIENLNPNYIERIKQHPQMLLREMT